MFVKISEFARELFFCLEEALLLNDIGKLCWLGFGILVGVDCFYLVVWELSSVGGFFKYIYI